MAASTKPVDLIPEEDLEAGRGTLQERAKARLEQLIEGTRAFRFEPGVYDGSSETFPLVMKGGVTLMGLDAARTVIDAGAVRFRPMMLTAAAVVVGASVILFDPIFQGLAISLMAGEVASLFFSRMTVPILYFLDKRWEFAHGHSTPLDKNSSK